MPTPSDDILDLLTAYSLNALEPEEMARTGELLEHDPELRALLAELRVTADALPYALPEAEPPPELRQKVLDYAVGRSSRTGAETSAVRVARGMRAWLAGLGVLAAGGMIAAALAFGQLGALQNELNRTRAALQQQIALNQQVAQAITNSPQPVVLRGAAGQASVLRGRDGKVVLVANMPPLNGGRVYQLWVIPGQGNPLGAGVFTVDQTGVGIAAIAPPTDPSQVYAVTEEPGPNGSPGPTSPILISNIPSS